MNMTLKKASKITALFMVVCLILVIIPFPAAPALAAEPGTYNSGDIAVINDIIANNGLNWTTADPADGSYVPEDWGYELPVMAYKVLWSEDDFDKRIIGLSFESDDMFGDLDLRDLTELTDLVCSGSQLTSLDVSGLINLESIDCSSNQLTSLNVSGLINLGYLNCSGNLLTSLDVSGLVSLYALSVTHNMMRSEDDVTGLQDIMHDDLIFLFWPQSLPGVYNAGDIAVINNVIANNGLNWTPADPADGSYVPEDWVYEPPFMAFKVLWSANDFDRRITGLSFESSDMFGALDLRGLTELTYLVCSGSLITSLDLDGLTKLEFLDCSGNMLTEIRLADCAYSGVFFDVRFNQMPSTASIIGPDLPWDNEEGFYFSPQDIPEDIPIIIIPPETPDDTGDETEQFEEFEEFKTPLAALFDIFDDVMPGEWFNEYVLWVYENGYMAGVGDGLFAPNMVTTEAMAAAFLPRYIDADLSQIADDETEGIPSGMWYSASASWAKTNGLLGDDGFTPDDPVTRGKLALIVLRFLDYLEIEYSQPETDAVFADADDMSAEEYDAFRILNGLGIFQGVGDDRMDPQGLVYRAHLAVLLFRIDEYLGSES